MASIFPHMNAEREALLSEAISTAQEKNQVLVKQLKQQIQTLQEKAKQFPLQPKRWQIREKLDIQQKIDETEKQLQNIKLDRIHLRKEFEGIEKKYSHAMDVTAKLQGNRLVSSSIHSATKTFRKTNVVLMAPENADECIRQHLRADLGLQEVPLMLTAGDVCDDCGVQMSVVSNDSMLSCPQCHKLRLLPNTMTTSALHGTDVESSATITKHRLPEWIEMAQGKEFAEPPDDVVETVAKFLIHNQMTGLESFQSIIAEERKLHGPFFSVQNAIQRLGNQIPDLEARLLTISSSSIRTALRGIVTETKADKFRKFYERSAKIAAIVSGYWPPRMTGQQEEMLRLLYTVAAPEYEKRRKPRQTYWPGGFPFFLRCLCILLGWDEFAAQFPIPSGAKEGGSRDLLRNEIWTELGWELVPYSGKPKPLKLPDGTMWSLTLEEDENEAQTEEAVEAKQMRKEVESKISIKKRQRVAFELECS